MSQVTLDYTPQPRQALLHSTSARLILYGGAVGGGKSHALRWDAIRWALRVPGIQVYLFRRTLPELQDNHINQIRSALGDLIPQHVNYVENRKTFEFANGSAIKLCYCEKEQDVLRYQGAEIHVLLVDEAGHLTPYQLNYLIGRSRLGGFASKVPEKFKDMLPRIAFASNPGGPGHNFLKEAFITAAEPEQLFYNRDYRDNDDPEDKGRLSVYIPAKMRDNRYLDSDYGGSLGGLPPELRDAYKNGDWDAVVGRALHTLDRERHMLRSFVPPRHWTHFMSLDWGSSAPFSVGWFCVSEGAMLEGQEGWPDRYLPPGAVIRYAEWYGVKYNDSGKVMVNQGLGLDSRTVARDIVEIEKQRNDPPMDYRIGDSAMWAVHDGISIAHNMTEATEGIMALIPSKKSREMNYNEIMCRLAGARNYISDGKNGDEPMFYCTANCTHWWRTVPTLTFDQTNPEKGPDSKQEDHCLVGSETVLTTDGVMRLDALPKRGRVWTTDGFQPFDNLGCTAHDVEVWGVTTTDGRTIKATPSHQFLCADGRYRRLDDLAYTDYLVSFPFSEDSGWHNTSTAKRTGSAGPTISVMASAFIGRCGRTTTDLFRRAITFTTRMATEAITTSPILNLCPLTGTSATMPSSGLNIWPTPSSALRRPRKSGTVPQRARNGIQSGPRPTESWGHAFHTHALNAARKNWGADATNNTARGPATSGRFVVGIQAITPLSERENVFNLHVPGTNNFAVSGGVIVHNCYDDTSYALRSQPFMTTKDDRFEQEMGAIVREARRNGRSGDPYAVA